MISIRTVDGFLKPTNITLGSGKIRETIKMLLGAPLVASTQQQIGYFFVKWEHDSYVWVKST